MLYLVILGAQVVKMGAEVGKLAHATGWAGLLFWVCSGGGQSFLTSFDRLLSISLRPVGMAMLLTVPEWPEGAVESSAGLQSNAAMLSGPFNV